uniref:Uncharacterized protein n=1 Tax=Meloidogyne enterolobii TaxID=390850 RepID=A0A6V7UFY8_MELEN|nr:unnamed protein product [Meloidogyne enterolobii]
MYYFNIKLFLIFLLSILFFCVEAKKLSSEQITCVNDYLLFSKNLKTEIYARKIKKEWKVGRRICKEDIEKIEKDTEIIEKEKMSKLMGEEYATKCFELNKELVEQYNEKLFNKLKNVILMRRNGVFSYKDYLDKINKKEILLLSKNVQMELDQLSFCMADKIYKIHKRAKEYDLFTIQPEPENMNNDKNAILDKYKIRFENKFYVLKLKSESLDDDLLKQNYEELSECVLFITNGGHKKIYLLLIEENQIYFDKFPDKVSTVTDIKINKEFKESNKDRECICLDNLIDPENEENQ